MTVNDLMTMVERLHPNQFSNTDKLRWLNQIEQTIWHEIIQTHRGPLEWEDMPVYDDVESEDELLAEDPWSKLYSSWMDSQIFMANKEGVNYQIAIGVFNDAYKDFEKWYNRTHMPKGAVNHLHIVDRGWGRG
jgi:hypothetical protein